MASLLYQIWISSGLITLGIYNLISTTRNFLKSPHSYSAKPFHPLSHPPLLRHAPLYLLFLFLLISFLHQTLISSLSDPLLKGSTSVHRFTSLHSALVLLLFLLLAAAALFSSSLPSDLLFASASAFFYLHYSSASSSAAFQTSDLESKIDFISASISAFSSLLCLLLAFNSRIFAADIGFASSIILKGLWALQRGLSLSVEAFIPEGCHKLLDVVSGVEGSTKCDLEESRLRAVAILDLVFVVHVLFVVVVVMVCYGFIAKGVGIRRSASYEALPTSSAAAAADSNHIQMKALTGTQH